MSASFSRASGPAGLRITDLRVLNLKGLPFRASIIRLDTNQGLSGYGEVRDGASASYALMLKSRLLDRNPCHIEAVFRSIRQFGGHARQGGGVSAVEMALCDLAGKAYGVPAFMLAGGLCRERVLLYADTESSSNPAVMGQRLKERMAQGYHFLKMDLGISMFRDAGGVQPDHLSYPPGMLDSTDVMHPFTGIRIAPKGLEAMRDYVAAVRSTIGFDVPLAVDHFGHIGVESCIQLGQVLEPFALAWLEDLIPWQFTEHWCRITRSLRIPTCTGEDIYLKDGFKDLIQRRAVSIVHPDLATSGGIRETKKIGDLAEEGGIAMALHSAGSPVSFLASVHCAAATTNFLALENHAVDIPDWEDLLEGIEKPLVIDGYAQVPQGPGLGFTHLNQEVVHDHLDDLQPRHFDMATDDWNSERAHDRLWS